MNTIKLTFIFLLAALAVLAGSPAAAKDKTSVPVIDSGASERRGLSLVVYNTNLALVREQRRIGKLERLSLLRFGDVPEQLIPSSVVVKSDAGLTVLEQQYQYDLLTVDRLLEKYVGKKVTLERLNARTETPERVSGTLLSLKGGRVIQFEDRVEVDPEGRFILPEVPENFVTRPTLTWLMESGKRSRGGTLDVSYLTRGVSWSCDYLLKLHGPGDGESAGLSGWVTI
ncbi:MAG: DUF4139 domain-containing protein, partial [Gemmatimonadota bacterium]|nr:DUF4139 domain-containing protein [Gemmatimonadota bacterium]